jgi:1-acyl-sn-glycerol-3-phosphate acyltransferase
VNLLYFLAHITFGITFRLYFRWRVCNAERVPRTGAVLLAANHASFMDPPVVGTALPRVIRYLARESLFRTPFLNWLLREVYALPVDRDGGTASGLRTVMGCLARGEAMVLFPEGTRTADGRLQPARPGIGLIVAKTSVPVIPVRLFGTHEAYGRHVRFPRPHRIVIKFGRPMDYAAQRLEAATCSRAHARKIYEEIARDIMQRIAALGPFVEKDQFP